MKEPYEEGLANRLGPESYAGDGNIAGVALARGTRRPAIELRNQLFSRADLVMLWGRQHGQSRYWRATARRDGVREPVHAWKLQAREPGDPVGFRRARRYVATRRNGQKTSPTVTLI